MIEQQLSAYISARRRQVQAARESAVHQNGEWSADGALQELDRLEGWLKLSLERDRLDAQLKEAAAGAFVAEPER